MHFANTVSVIFLFANGLLAVQNPADVVFHAYRSQNDSDEVIAGMFIPRAVGTDYDLDLGIAPRAEESCDRKVRCKKNKIRNPVDITKCIRCPPLTKADPTHTLCIQDNDASKEDKRKQYEEKIKEKVQEKFNKFKEKAKERLDKKKEAKNKEWEEKDKQRQDKRNQKKFRRMAVCSPAVAASIGTVAMLELADGGFSEDLFDSINNDMLEFWPLNDIDNDWLDKALPDDESDIINEAYVQEFLVVGDATSGSSKRSITMRSTAETIVRPSDETEPDIEITGLSIETTDSSNRSAESTTEKRNIFNSIGNAFRALIRLAVAAATRRAGGGGPISRATKYFSDGKQPNLKKPGESKLSHAEQKDKAKEISKDKNWKKCLRGEKPEK
ncbi:hypothetical protein BKA63DRAFT_519056 [Paraphoma chrysanthemicola]|nr:hypothetical protein BKA63DRAFT_519056 [Paraphoma chrysanthemicola]